MSEKDNKDITFVGRTRYTSEVSRFMGEVMSQVAQRIREKAQNPATVEEAFLLREAEPYPSYREYCEILLEEGVGEFNDQINWTGETPEQLTQKLLNGLKADEHLQEEIRNRAQAVAAATELIDAKNTESIQMVLIRDQSKEPDDTSGYTYLIVYPPEELNGATSRRREASFPTAMCHTFAALALMDEPIMAEATKPKIVKIEGISYTMRAFKMGALSDKQLETTVRTHGRTIGDKLSQAGLAVIDRLTGRKGEHIDVFSILKDQEYALAYALACHRGIGSVINDRINLPPL